MSTTTQIPTLKINYLTQAQYDAALADDQIDENQLYLTPNTLVTRGTGDGAVVLNSTSNTASGGRARASGYNTQALGDYSSANGRRTIARGWAQTVIGQNNLDEGAEHEIPDRSSSVLIIGNGTDTTPSDALTVSWAGDVMIAGGLTLNGNETMTAFVTEYGTVQGGTGNNWWSYRKWSNGTIEAWGVCSASAVAGTVWASPIYYYDWNVTFPTGIFDSAPTEVYATCGNYQWSVAGTGAATATGVGIRLIKPTSSAQALVVRIYAFKYPS